MPCPNDRVNNINYEDLKLSKEEKAGNMGDLSLVLALELESQGQAVASAKRPFLINPIKGRRENEEISTKKKKGRKRRGKHWESAWTSLEFSTENVVGVPFPTTV